LGELGVTFDVQRTERPLHGIELAKRAAKQGYEVIVSVGGDGTMNEVLNGILLAEGEGEARPALGVLCVGRGNDFAFGVDIPIDLEAGCRAIAAGERRTIDVARMAGGDYPEGRHIGNGVGIGFDAVVGFVAAKQKRLRGFASYLVAALKTIFLYFKAPLVRIDTDHDSLEMRALMVSIMNGRRMGGGFMMAPKGDPADGLLDLCIAREVSRPGIFALIPRFMKGSQETHPAILTERVRWIEVTALEGALPSHGDGETLCEEGQTIRVEIVPAAIEIIVPAAQGMEATR
jgi:YegS/Rv2252/BmrU family lipid kinase